MEEKKININLTEVKDRAVVEIREGKAPDLLQDKAPLELSIEGIINAPFEFIKSRKESGQFAINDCHVLVSRDDISLTFVFNERDPYNNGTVSGTLQFDSRFRAFGINTDKAWTPAELAIFIKMNRAYFPDRAENMKLVTALMNFSATVNHKIERSVQENGNRSDNFAQVVNSNLPPAFKITLPIFKGMQPESVEVETFAHVNGREVSFNLISPGAMSMIEEMRDKVLDEQINQIREIAPGIAIIEV